MHPVHNCHHIKSCHPPVTQYITSQCRVYIPVYNFVQFVILKSQWQGPRCVLFCTLYTVSSSWHLPWSFPPSPYLPSSHAPPLIFSPHPFPSSTLLQPSLTSSILHSLPLLPPSPPSPCSLLPILHCLPPCLPASRRPIQCVWQAALSIV